jgi:hypothetical protein
MEFPEYLKPLSGIFRLECGLVKPQVVPLFHRHKLFDSFSLICGRK